MVEHLIHFHHVHHIHHWIHVHIHRVHGVVHAVHRHHWIHGHVHRRHHILIAAVVRIQCVSALALAHWAVFRRSRVRRALSRIARRHQRMFISQAALICIDRRHGHKLRVLMVCMQTVVAIRISVIVCMSEHVMRFSSRCSIHRSALALMTDYRQMTIEIVQVMLAVLIVVHHVFGGAVLRWRGSWRECVTRSTAERIRETTVCNDSRHGM
mmetsp:Transcript_20988/g.33514  ORF Transcript_20988/g.33514 Transcript_20988/m.33514 type:complete len:211 (+) Transcript_20988:1745-2377(+)